ncbi:MAG: glycosyltransferase [Alphaproteobacteria bacterium]|nr:glycosyltransferase [Alphaproteobacteria bacterium]
MIAAIIGGIAAAAWLYLIAFRGLFWRVRAEDIAVAAGPARAVVAVIPARDEADVIGRAVSSLLAQDYPGPLHIIVVDDHSGDGTAAVAREAAAKAGTADRLTVLSGDALPAGWSGKLWALRQGIAAAEAHRPDYLLLTDADIVHAPHSLAGLVARAESGGYDLVSLMVRLHCASAWERLLIPAFVWFFFMLYPPRRVADRRRRTAAAAGGCMLIRRTTLARIGGIDSIQHEIIDDCALARRVKAQGRVWLGLAHDTISIREYRSWRPLWEMIARCAFAQLGYSALALAGMVLALLVIFVAPPLLLFSSSATAIAIGALVWLAMSLAYLPILRLYRCPAWLGPLLPLIALFYTAATIGSAIAYWRGRGGRWKGCYQAATP